MIKIKRLIVALGLCIVILSGMFAFAACAKEIHVTVGYRLYQYDTEVGAEIECPSTINIECGKRYAIVFTVEADEDVDMEIEVNLRKYVDEDSTQDFLDKDKQENKGLGYTGEEGVYTAHVIYKSTEDKQAEILEQCLHSYFIIGLDAIPQGATTLPIEVTIKSEKTKEKVIVNNSDKFLLTVTAAKGNMQFTKDANFVERLGAVKRMSFDVIKPDKCYGGVSIAFYRDGGEGQKNGLYGTVNVTMEDFTDGSGTVTVNLGEMFSQFVANYDEGKYAGYNVIVSVTAFGGTNYNDKTFEFSYEIKE